MQGLENIVLGGEITSAFGGPTPKADRSDGPKEPPLSCPFQQFDCFGDCHALTCDFLYLRGELH